MPWEEFHQSWCKGRKELGKLLEKVLAKKVQVCQPEGWRPVCHIQGGGEKFSRWRDELVATKAGVQDTLATFVNLVPPFKQCRLFVISGNCRAKRDDGSVRQERGWEAEFCRC